MKRKMLSLLLGLSLCLSLLPAALAEEASAAATEFTDVPAGSWFESGVKLCAEKGIMIGIGDGTFAPDKTLTAAECLTLALRLYDLFHDGKGIIPAADKDWDRITITADDGTVFTGRPGAPFEYQRSGPKGQSLEGILFAVQPEQEELAQKLDGMEATVTIHDEDSVATLSYLTRSYIDGTSENMLFAAVSSAKIYHAFQIVTNNYWWVDSAAMVQKLGLDDWSSQESNGFRDLYMRAASGNTAHRSDFADSLATATGTLPVLQEQVSIPDLGIPEQGVAAAYENILMLYRSGILNGKDETGNFDYYGRLTRAEAAVMVARVLDPTLRIGAKEEMPTSQPTTSPAPSQLPINVEVGVIDSSYPSYNAALASLTEDGSHTIEKQLESPLCTVAVVSHSSPHGGVFKPYLIYKANSPLGEGLVRNLPSVRKGLMGYTPAPDTLALSDDGQTLTYSYHYVEPIVAEASGEVIRQAGTYTYTVELAKGLPTLDYQPLPDVVTTPGITTDQVEVEVNRNLEEPFTTYAAAVEKLRSGMGYSNERTFDTDTCTIFCYDLGGFMNAPLDYLRVVYKAGGAYPEGTILDLPFTTGRGWHVNTRTDSMILSDDGKTFTYTYTFEEIGNYGNPVQAGGTYTYVFDVPSGTVTLTQPVLRTVTYAQALEQVTQEEGHTVEKIIEGAGVTAVLRYSLLKGRDSAKSYNIYLVYNSGGLKKEGTVEIEQPPFTAVNGFYTDRAPDHMFFSKDGRSFFCTYYYAPHDDSPYTSIIDLEQGYHSSGHLPTVVELLSAGTTVDKRVDGPAATALLVYDEHDGARDYILYLINEETGGTWPALLPSTYVGAADDGSVYYPTDRAPDSISFSADGSILTYVYKFAQALEKDGIVYHEAGTYTYKVNVTTGELSVAHT